MLTDYVNLGGLELVNHSRLETYLQTVGSPLTDASVCRCDSFTNETLEELPYTTPAEDSAPWYDPDVPESADFAGLLLLTMDGIDTYPVQRTVANSVTGGGSIGPAKVVPLTITCTAVLLASTCCAVEYGLAWLQDVLSGCEGGGCDGDCMTLYNCCPEPGADPAEFNAQHRRTLRRVALTSGPTVTARHGDGDCSRGQCSSGADLVTVEFVLTAATPWFWTDTEPLMEITPPIDPGTECVTWCVHGDDEGCDGGCRFAACSDSDDGCSDPLCRPPAPPVPTMPQTCFCEALAVETECWEIDLSHRPARSVDMPMIRIRAEDKDIRNLTLTFYERTAGDDDLSCEDMAALQRCSPLMVFNVKYVPAGGALTLDGQIGRAMVECGGTCESSSDVYGDGGLPVTFAPLSCAKYCLCVSTDVQFPPSPSSVISVDVSGRGW